MNARVLLPLLLLGCRPPVPSMPAAAAAVALEAGLAGEPLPSLRYNQVFRIATHNSYWVRRDPAIEIEASGVQERILDQLLVEHARGLEIDVHPDDMHAHHYTVYHTNLQTNTFCTPLEECMKPLRLFHYALPRHEVVTVVIELKELVGYNFDDHHTPADLDGVFTNALHDPDGTSWLFTPSDLMKRCEGATTLRQCVQRPEGWPSIEELRGKFIVVVIGNYREGDVGHGPEGWVDYANDGMAGRSRVGFAMKSNWIDVDGRGTNPYRPAAAVRAADDASVFWQVENLDDPRVGDMLKVGVVVRGHDSFSITDQDERLAAGFQMLQTDYPWLQTEDAGPARPFRALEGGTAILEPGARLLLSAPDDRVAFVGRREESVITDWETLPSTTRRSPDPRYAALTPTHPRGRGCLRGTVDPNDGTADSVTVCRRVIDGEYAEVSVVKIAGHKMSYEYRRQAPAHTFGRRSIGDMIRLRVDTTAAGSVVDAYSASELGKDGKPAWVHIAKVRSTSAFLWQGLAGTDDVLFVDTLRNGVVIRTSDLVAGAVPGATLRDLSSVP